MMDSLQQRAEEAEEAEDLHSAFELWKELAAKDPEASFFLRYGSVAKKLEKWDEAEDAFAQALRLDPASSLILENIGSLWAHRTDKPDADSFQMAKQWFLRALEEERNARLLTQLGATFVALNEGEAARDVFEEAIRLDPECEEALYNLAVIEEETDLQKSVELLERAIQIDPDYAAAHQVLGRVYEEMADITRAEYHFRRSLEIDPADYWSHLYLANLLGAEGRNIEAEQIYRFAANMHPEITSGMEIFARFLESIGKPEEAAGLRENMTRS
jgi:Tfp pilus assembly protein PilF